MSSHIVERLIKCGDGDAALLYLYILKNRGIADTCAAAQALGRTAQEITSSMKLLAKLGLLRYDGESEPAPAHENTPVQKDETPEYTAQDIKHELENGTAFSSLVAEVQRSLGKILSSDDLIKLFGIYDHLGLPPEVILQLVTHCVAENRRRYGEGKTPTMRYIEKAAYTWEREGIFTLERAEEHLKNLAIRHTRAAEIKRVLQIKDRALSASERRYVDSWIGMGYPADSVEIAYDRTLVKTGKLSWGYMDSIIKSWYSKGLISPEDIHKKDGRNGGKPSARAQNAPPAPQISDIERMKKLIEKMKEG